MKKEKDIFGNVIDNEMQEELNSSALGNTHVEIPVFESFKGKQMYGSKTWEAEEHEKKTINRLAILFAVLVVCGLVVVFLPISLWIKFVLFFLAVSSGIGMLGGYMFYVAFRHHKEDPMEMHYYDVDYKINHLTGEGYDNTKEITEERK